MSFHFTVTLNKVRIALLFLRESFAINFRVIVLFFENQPARFPSRASHTVYVVAQEVLQWNGSCCVFAMRSRNMDSFSGFLLLSCRIIFRNRFVRSFSRILRTLIFFL